MAAGLGGLDLAAGQRRGFKDARKADGGFVIWLFWRRGGLRAAGIDDWFLPMGSWAAPMEG
jgi:hypothetical protein